MLYTKEILIKSIINEYSSTWENESIDPGQYLLLLEDMTYDELVEETNTVESLSLIEYVERWYN